MNGNSLVALTFSSRLFRSGNWNKNNRVGLVLQSTPFCNGYYERGLTFYRLKFLYNNNIKGRRVDERENSVTLVGDMNVCGFTCWLMNINELCMYILINFNRDASTTTSWHTYDRELENELKFTRASVILPSVDEFDTNVSVKNETKGYVTYVSAYFIYTRVWSVGRCRPRYMIFFFFFSRLQIEGNWSQFAAISCHAWIYSARDCR